MNPTTPSLFATPDDEREVKWAFAAGMPDPVTFPAGVLADLFGQVLTEQPSSALQYNDGGNAGDTYLRELLAARERAHDGRPLGVDNILLTAGATQGLLLAFDAFLQDGDVVAIESPTWDAVISYLRARRVDVVAIPIDGGGLRVDVLERELHDQERRGKRVRLLYTIPTFQVPTGTCLTESRRRRLLELATQWDFRILEDNVYGELRYGGKDVPTLYSLDESGVVIKVDSFSKVIAPALRIGWVTARSEVCDQLTSVRFDLGVSRLVARVAAMYVEGGHLDRHVRQTNKLYAQKLAVLEACLQKSCGAWVTWRHPEGGFFLWLQLDDSVDAGELLEESLMRGLSMRAGRRLFVDADKGDQYVRLAFPAVGLDEIPSGVAALRDAIQATLSPR